MQGGILRCCSWSQRFASARSRLAALGFTAEELARALAPATTTGLTDEDAAPPLCETAVTVPGDIWCMGPYRVACGDSTDNRVVSAVLGGVEPHLMVTDPPYGVAYDPAWRHRAGVNRSDRIGKVNNDSCADWAPAWALFRGNIAYVWHGALHSATVAESLTRHRFTTRAQIIWGKQRL
jgi:hypothetical protein